METDLLGYVRGNLERSKGRWKEISGATGVPYDTIAKIFQRQIKDPKISKLQVLANYFREQVSN